MNRHEDEATDPALLGRVRNWADHQAWTEFMRRYDPLILRCCRAFRLGPEATEELCQEARAKLVVPMRDYAYDPKKSFRGWLSLFCRSRGVDFLRRHKAKGLPAPGLVDLRNLPAPTEPETTDFLEKTRWLQKAERARSRVAGRVDPRSLRVFESVDLDGASVREASDVNGMSYAAGFAAVKRVRRMLREEGDRLLAESR